MTTDRMFPAAACVQFTIALGEVNRNMLTGDDLKKAREERTQRE